mgnify:CR=1 FL=1
MIITLGVLFSVLGFLSVLMICGVNGNCMGPRLIDEFGGVILSSILVLTGGGLVISQVGK